MSELDPDGPRLLRYLISRIPTVDPDDVSPDPVFGPVDHTRFIVVVGAVGVCMVRRPIARKISVVGGWSAQMYPAYLWSDAPGHNGVRASPVYKVGRT